MPTEAINSKYSYEKISLKSCTLKEWEDLKKKVQSLHDEIYNLSFQLQVKYRGFSPPLINGWSEILGHYDLFMSRLSYVDEGTYHTINNFITYIEERIRAWQYDNNEPSVTK